MENIVYTRKLSKEEAELIDINKIEFHEWSKGEVFNLDAEDFDKIKSDILENGMTEPITLLDGEILDGRVRWASIIAENINFEIPYEEYIGLKDERSVKDWLWRRNIVRTQMKKTALATMAVDDWMPYFEELKKKKKLGKEKVVLAAEKVGISPDSVRKAFRIKRKNIHVYEFMQQGLVTIEEGLRIVDKCEKLSDEWLAKIYKWMRKTGGDFQKAVEAAKLERERAEFQKINAKYEKESSKKQRTMIKPSKYKGRKISISNNRKNIEKARLALVVDKLNGENIKQYNERVDAMAKELNDVLARYGVTDLHLIKGDIGKHLFNVALNKAKQFKGVTSVPIMKKPIVENPKKQTIHLPYEGDIIK